MLLLAPLAGSMVDRLPRVRVMISSDLARMLLASILAVWNDHVLIVYAVAFGLSAGAVFFNPAANSLLPTLVADDELVAANSGIWSAAVLSQVALAPVSGLLAATAGFEWAFTFNAASYGVSAILLRGLRAGEQPLPVRSGSVWKQGLEALTLLRQDRLLRALAIAQALAALSAGATSTLLVVLATRHLGVDGRSYGAMIAAIGVGAFLGPLILTRVSYHIKGPADLRSSRPARCRRPHLGDLHRTIRRARHARALRPLHVERKRLLQLAHSVASEPAHTWPGLQRIRRHLAEHAPGEPAPRRPRRRHDRHPRSLLRRRSATHSRRAHRTRGELGECLPLRIAPGQTAAACQARIWHLYGRQLNFHTEPAAMNCLIWSPDPWTPTHRTDPVGDTLETGAERVHPHLRRPNAGS